MPKAYFAHAVQPIKDFAMYLIIPEIVLGSKKLSSDEKILLSYVLTLQNAGKACYGSPEYIGNLLGLNDVADLFETLGERNFLVSTFAGKELSGPVYSKIKGGKKDG